MESLTFASFSWQGRKVCELLHTSETEIAEENNYHEF